MMSIRTSLLPVSALVLLLTVTLLAADGAVTLQNVIDPGPNRADEPFIEEYSFSAAVRFMDSASLFWQKNRKCFACHSNYVFLLARPAVTYEVPVHKTVRSALEHLAENPRKTHYWMTEAVMVASILAQNDAATTGKLHPVTRKALDRIWTAQREDGGWTWLDENEPPSEIDDHYGVTMAALGVGVAPDNYCETPAAKKGLENIRRYFRDNPPVNMHHRAMKMLASLHVDGIMTVTERKEVIKDLFALQKSDGGWGLATLGNWKRSDGKQQDYESSDGYGTGFAIYALCSAGISAEDPGIRKGIAWLKTHQRASGRWFTRSMKKDSKHYITHSGTAYAILALEACAGLQNSEEQVNADLNDRLIEEMKSYFGDKQGLIDHTMAVYGYANQLHKTEGGDPLLVKAGALYHDIGIPEARRVHGSSAGKYQEIEGPPIAGEILKKLDIAPESVDRICRIIANHHTAHDKATVNTIEFQIVWDADGLVNHAGRKLGDSEEKISKRIEQLFRTPTGKKMATEMFIKN